MKELTMTQRAGTGTSFWPFAALFVAAFGIAVSTFGPLQQGGQALYLIAGYATDIPEESTPPRVFRLESGTKKLVELLHVLPTAKTYQFIRAHHDGRLLVVATPHYHPTQIVTLDMDKPCEPRTIGIEVPFLPLDGHLLQIPGRGPYYAVTGFDRKDNQNLLFVVNLLTGEPETPDPELLRYARPAGLPGPEHSDNDTMGLLIDAEGRLVLSWNDARGRRLIDMGFPPIPPGLRPKGTDLRFGREEDKGAATWYVGTDDYDLIYEVDSAEIPMRYLALHRAERRWRVVTVPGQRPDGRPALKPLGSWIGGVLLGKPETWSMALWDRARSEGRADDPRYQQLLRRNPASEIYLYDAETDQQQAVKTGDIDSTALLVDDGVVYYRVRNAVYRKSVRGAQSDKPELLAEHKDLGAVSWAFTGPSCEVKEQ
jgi:hypothetical protein